MESQPSDVRSTEPQTDYAGWGVERTCQYLRAEGLGEWEDAFREHRITGVGLRYLADADLEKMGLKFLGDRLRVLHSLRKLWQIEVEQSKVFNDPIHGHMEMHPLLIRIIDTPQFQRLRHIKQLGGVYFVFPGASHNRFEHSLGVAHLAGELVRDLKRRQPELHITDRDVLCVQIAGLCHDLGHGPFSHMFDRKFIPKARPGFTWKHEDASVKMFNHLVNVNELKSAMKTYKLRLPRDLYFIRELIAGPMDPKDLEDSEDPEDPKDPKDPEDPKKEKPAWPYRGRPENKSFLYEIVSNKRNGIDVDKWDYFARDCYHLGIKNNFDHGRCLMFASVCEVDGQKQICFRDKEVEDLYDMFYTRICLHRRAYQHKAAKIVETMITEAFLQADEFIEFEGSGGQMFKLSDTINDMVAYTKVTDDVFEKILNSSSDELKDSREILQDVVCRRFYKCIGQALPTQLMNVTVIEMKASWEANLARRDPQDVVLNPQDFFVDVIKLDYGMNDQNPIDSVGFYSKDHPDKADPIPQNQVFGFLPETFTKQLIRVYCKKLDSESLEAAKENFDRWCEDPDNQMPQDEAPEETPVESSGTT